MLAELSGIPAAYWAGLVVILIATAGVFIWLRLRRQTPEERERRRRLLVHSQGRTTDGVLTEVREMEDSCFLYYRYIIGGVEYATAQDVTSLLDVLSDNLDAAIGTVAVKYERRNPSNSIIICEEWSGLRVAG